MYLVSRAKTCKNDINKIKWGKRRINFDDFFLCLRVDECNSDSYIGRDDFFFRF